MSLINENIYLKIKSLKTRLSFWITEKEIEEWKDNTDIFFILSQGRSGTNFLASLLRACPSII